MSLTWPNILETYLEIAHRIVVYYIYCIIVSINPAKTLPLFLFDVVYEPHSVINCSCLSAVIIVVAQLILTSAGYLVPFTVCSEPLSSHAPQWK